MFISSPPGRYSRGLLLFNLSLAVCHCAIARIFNNKSVLLGLINLNSHLPHKAATKPGCGRFRVQPYCVVHIWICRGAAEG